MPAVTESYDLSDMQHAMLVNSLRAPCSGVDILQRMLELPVAFDLPILRRAWQRVVDHHEMLRVAFRWEGLDKPRQDVYDHVQAHVHVADWRGLSSAEQVRRLREFVRADRVRGFDMARAPLARVSILRLGEADTRLLFTCSHAILDGRAVGFVLAQFSEVYESLRNGRVVELPESCSYRRYIEWLAARDEPDDADFWIGYLEGVKTTTRLADCGTRGDLGQRPFEQRLARLSAEQTTALQQLVDSGDLTMNTVMQGAWAIVLSRHSRERRVLFGAVKTCRRSTFAGAENVVGLMLNTVPMCVTVAGDQPVLGWLETLRAQWLELRAHEHTPLSRIIESSEIPPGEPLFESIFVLEQESRLALGSPDAAAGLSRAREFNQPNYPLSLSVFAGTETKINVDYDPARFDAASVDRILDHFKTILMAMAANPEARVGLLSMLTDAERRELLVDRNPESSDFQSDATLHELFEAQVTTHPNAIAVSFDDEVLTYSDLNRRANQLAHHLIRRGVGPSVMVGLCVERSVEMVVSILGILKAGGAYVPLDPMNPAERIAFILADAQVPVLVTQESVFDELPAYGTDVVLLDQQRSELEREPAENPGRTSRPTDIAYVIYTSGSTGQPKGVQVEHRHVARLFSATEAWFQFDERDVWTLFHSYAFDFSVWEMWGALLHGGRLVVVPYLVSRSPEQFHDLLSRERVTVLNQTPSAFYELIRADEYVGGEPDLRLVIFGGEALKLQNLRPWFERHGNERPQLANMYGITETTVHVTYRPITMADIRQSPGSVIGLPIPDLRVYILDENFEPVPVGVPGELYVGGDGVARGYLGRPALTAARFIPDPFAASGGRLYRTGDVARFLPSRDIEYLGRNDQQVKIRGHRIELGEIESTLVSHDAVVDAVARCWEDALGEKRLVAYVVTNGEDVPATTLRSYLRQTLPDYLIPAAFSYLESLPLTANGKVDHEALPVPERDRQVDEPLVEPRTTTEERVAEIWKEVLQLQSVGVNDNFFALGGHSLMATRVLARLSRTFNVRLPFTGFFERPTVAGVARFVDQPRARAAAPARAAGPDAGREQGEL